MSRCPHCGGEIEVVVKRPAPNKKVNTAEVAALLRFGATPKEVAELYGVSRQAIYQVKWRESGEAIPGTGQAGC